jgi:16S rRNA (adenine1518-N6/adenine1519-N6)-dimethyltransferase
MNLLDQTQEICKAHDIWLTRTKGQNFLIEEDIYDRIIAAADLKKDDVILEVGPGLGFLTAKLAAKVGRVIAVELDDKLAAYLREKKAAEKINNLDIFNENILDINSKDTKYQIPKTKYKIVANLPYNITSVFIRKFLTVDHAPDEMVLMLQKEVAERICAKPGEMSLLALSVQYFAEPEIVDYVKKENFWPQPKVDSAIIRITCHSGESRNPVDSVRGGFSGSRVKPEMTDERALFRLAKFGFSAKRKMLKNNLAGGLHLAPAEVEKVLVKIGLNPKARAEELAIEDWGRLVLEFK